MNWSTNNRICMLLQLPWEEVAVLAVDYSNRDYVGQDLAAS